MFKNLSFLTLAAAMSFTASMSGCIVVGDDTATLGTTADVGDTTGDGDGDTGDGDGDTGDGDGDTGDGDGDGDQGDGDGDTGDGDGDGDGDTGGGLCGWLEAEMYYGCGGMGEDPGGTFPLACPDGLVDGAPCDSVDPPLAGEGCCAGDTNYYCGDNMGELIIVEEACG